MPGLAVRKASLTRILISVTLRARAGSPSAQCANAALHVLTFNEQCLNMMRAISTLR
jgi:hypothetical protein